MTVAKHFCQPRWIDGPLNRPSDFELHAHKPFRLDDLIEINSWFRCKTAIGIAVDPGESARPNVLFVEQDFNSLVEGMEDRNIPAAQIREFFSLSPAEMLHILQLYFPDGGQEL